jgi:HK97 family phage prohead protease
MAIDHERDFAFTLTRSDDAENDGLTFEGYAAVFNTAAHIRDADGEYDEVFSPGAFKQTINRGKPYFMFCHGKHPLLGQMPLGTITELREDARGLFVKARLTDNWLIAPVRDAIRDGAVTGMSIRFGPVKEKWTGRPSLACRHGELRTVHEARVVELGPVVVPSYADTTASVRSAFHNLEDVVDGLTINVGLRDATTTVSTHDQTVLDLVKSAIKDRLGLNDSDDVSPTDFYEADNKLVFTVFGSKASEYSGSFQADYTYADGVVTLTGDPVAVQATGYEPRSNEDAMSTMLTRDDVTFADITEAVEDAIETLIGVDDVTSDVWVADITSSWAVFSVWGALEDKWPDYWKVTYTIDTDENVTLGTPEAVEQTYVPKATPPARSAELRNARNTTGPSTEAATRSSTEAAAKEDRVPRGPMTSPAEREAVLREYELTRRGIKVGAT